MSSNCNGCSSSTPQPCCQDCVPTNPCESGCLDIISTSCIETSVAIDALDVVAGDKLDSILESIGETIEGLSPVAYGDFNYSCLSVLSINTPQKFAEGVSSVLCQILGSQVPGSVTSLSTINSSIQVLQATVNNTINTQSLLSGFGSISGLAGATATATQLFTALQQIAIDHENDINTLTSLGVVSLTANDSSTIDFTTSGSGNHTLTGSVKVSAVSDNAITVEADGLHVISPVITVSDTATVDLTVSGAGSHTLQAAVKISAVGGNVTIAQADGIYTPAASLTETAITANDSTTIDFTTSGTSNHTITAAVKIDPSVNNIITDTGNGIFADTSSLVLASNSVTDTQLRDSSAYSIMGRSAGSTGDPGDIVAAADGVLRRSGTGALQFGTLVTGNIGNDQVTFAKIQNVSSGTLVGRTSASTGDLESLTPGSNISIAGGVVNTYGRTLIGIKVYITSDTWTKPAGCNAVLVHTIGAGGGGAGATSNVAEAAIGSGGGAGAHSVHFLTSGLGTTETVTVGVGGAAGDSGNAYAGQNGTGSSFGSHTGVNGGAGGITVASDTAVNLQPGGAGGLGLLHPTGQIYVGQGAQGGQAIRLSGTVASGGESASSSIGGSSNAIGSGGAGEAAFNGSAVDGNAGGTGAVIVYEFS